ncbi:MAG: hypothetical protein EHM67_08410 [Hyphomicrobiaceae bacterium]|nr:MAG: hypothetical protein EHM67_08410 [Hyphomicrobiaceae bacterium]
MTERNGLDHQPIDTLFGEDSFDAGVIKGLGHVIVREARLADIWPYMGGGDGANASEFGLRLLAASIEINGRRFTFEEFGRISVKHSRKLQDLFAKVSEINGMTLDTDDEGDREKNAEGAVVNPAPKEGSADETAS